jgi:hypothetical protein
VPGAVAFPLIDLKVLGGGAAKAAPEGWAPGALGGGMRMVRGEGGAVDAPPELELPGAEDSGAGLVFFSRTGGAGGSACPVAFSSPAPMLLVPVSWFSRKKEESSSVR